jgi:hypothetical protein
MADLRGSLAVTRRDQRWHGGRAPMTVVAFVEGIKGQACSRRRRCRRDRSFRTSR